jgi:dihydrolipoamide dehydrogenase
MRDLAIIGGGPGGYVAALRARQLGLDTVLFDRRGEFGGTCLWRGCIPTKTFLHIARYLEETKKASQWGVRAQAELDMPGLLRFKDRVVAKLSKGIGGLLQKRGVEVVVGDAVLLDPHRVQAAGAVHEARHVLVAAGSVPAALPGLEIDGRHILSSDHVLALPSVPKRVLIIGAGAIGVEFASVYAAFGAEVTLVEVLPRILPLEEPWVSEEIEKSLKRRGVKVLAGARVAGAEPAEGGVRAAWEKEGTRGQSEADFVLLAVGRKPATAGLGLEKCGVALGPRGTVPVDAFGRTAVPSLYAIGDVTATPMLAHAASREGEVAVEHIAGLEPHPIDYALVPSCTYSLPEAASVGMKSREAEAAGRAVKVGKFPFVANSKASAMGENEGAAFVLRDAGTDEVLGVSLVGPHATELIMEASAALYAGLTSTDIAHIVHPHPTLSEALAEANLDALGRAIHL